jgi:hypothetical protein
MYVNKRSKVGNKSRTLSFSLNAVILVANILYYVFTIPRDRRDFQNEMLRYTVQQQPMGFPLNGAM